MSEVPLYKSRGLRKAICSAPNPTPENRRVGGPGAMAEAEQDATRGWPCPFRKTYKTYKWQDTILFYHLNAV